MDARGSAYVAATLHALNGSLHNVSLRAGRQRSLHPRTRRKAPDDEGALFTFVTYSLVLTAPLSISHYA